MGSNFERMISKDIGLKIRIICCYCKENTGDWINVGNAPSKSNVIVPEMVREKNR